jgi:hypothetical protein
MSRRSQRARRLVAFGLLILAPLARPALADPTPPGVASSFVPPVATASVNLTGNLINNGDFEINTFAPLCYFNLPNANVTAGLAGITAYGAAQEIDVMTDGTPCLFNLPPQSGRTKLAIHRQNPASGAVSDEFSFDLSSPITFGNVYTVTFYAISDPYIDPDIGAVDIGLSSSPTAFGTSVFAGTPSTSAWTLLTNTFVAPVNAAYLTVRVVPGVQAWIHIDNFSLIAGGPTPVADGTWGRLKTLYR